MKKLIVTLMFILVASCGGSDVMPGNDFFNEYFAECVEMCQINNTWLEYCKPLNGAFEFVPIPGVQECVLVQWDCGLTNHECVQFVDKLTKKLLDNNCDEWNTHRCLGIPQHCNDMNLECFIYD